MITIEIKGIDDVIANMKVFERNVPYAIANGVNAIARQIKTAEETRMSQVFKSPTPYTMKALKLTPAKAPRSITASVFFKDPPTFGQKGHYLLPQVEGGQRPLKPSELAFNRRYIVPSKYASLDQYGNLGRGRVTKMMSAAGVFRESGSRMNRTRKAGKVGDYIYIRHQRGKLPPGIYERVQGNETGGRIGRYMLARAMGAKKKDLNSRYRSMFPRGLKPVAIIPNAKPTYTKRFDFYETGKRIFDRYSKVEMQKAINAEISKAIAFRGR
jgi:hypothetical protein